MYKNGIRWLKISGLLILLAGCKSTIPFQKPESVLIEPDNSSAMIESFKAKLPRKYSLTSSILFEKGFGSFSAIGITEIDIDEEEFLVAGISPAGLKLFELSVGKDGVKKSFAIEEVSKRGDFAKVIAGDIKKIYFNLVPPLDSKIIKKKYTIIFESPRGDGMIQHIFGGSGGYLLEKKYYEKHRLIWSIAYYEYILIAGKLSPGGIIVHNYKYRYSLSVKQKGMKIYEHNEKGNSRQR